MQTMNNVLFWGVCIPLRIFLVYFHDHAFLRIFALIVSIVWLSGALQHKTIGFFGGDAWWSSERVNHGILWGLYAITGQSVWLFADVMLGVLNKQMLSP